LVRLGFAVVAIGFLSAFSYPLVEEGYGRVGESVYKREQRQMLEQSIGEYVRFKGDIRWGTSTPTREILNDLASGVDMALTGAPQSLLPSNVSVDELEREYRIVYKGPKSYRVIER
jgi:hypothetical protein